MTLSIPGYRLGEVLGRGAMGIVFEAERLSDGQAVALKTARGTTASMVAAIRREILALSRVRHPGVARIVDHGVHDGLSWYAMELLRERTLRDCIRARSGHLAGGAPRDLRELLTIVHRLCGTLSFLHSQGIIHRDLKPDNVFVRADGAPVLVDFGIAVSFGVSGDCDIGENILELAGTPEYMSPEQIQGRGVDARADLYSLGCILFECLTGQTPFGGKTLGAVISRHLSVEPVAPSTLAPDVPEALDALVLRLLQKKPADRLGYADDVASRLVELGVEPDDRFFGEARRSYVYRPEFVGRADVMARFEPLLRGQGHSERRILIDGESGVGKTRLLLEISTNAAFRGFAVVPLQCGTSTRTPDDRSTLTAPLAPFRAFLTRVADDAREGGPERTEELLGGRGHVLAAYEPALSSVLSEADRAQPLPSSASPAIARARVFECLRQTLFAYAGNRPLLLMLDDLQWADELTLAFLEHLDPEELELREAHVVLACRSDEGFAALESSSTLGRSFERISLGRLSHGAVSEMIIAMLALNKTPQKFTEFLFKESNGNPFFVTEYLRAAIDQGFLLRDSAGRWRLRRDETEQPLSIAPVSAPVSVNQVMLRRITGLTPTADALVHAAAVLGREFEPELLERVVDFNDSAELDALIRRQIFEPAKAGRLQFVHDKLRELVYASVSADELGTLHRRAAEAIETTVLPASKDAALPALAHHWSHAGVLDRAALYFTLAGDHARRVYANGEALAHYEAAIDAARGLVERSDRAANEFSTVLRQLEERRADVLMLRGDDVGAREALQRAHAGLPGAKRIWRSSLLLKCARTLERTHQHLEALDFYREAEDALAVPALHERGTRVELPKGWPLALPDESEEAHWEQWVKLQVERVWVHYWLADVDAMEALVDRVRPIVAQRGNPAQHARFLQALIHHNLRRDRYAVAEETVALARGSLAAAQESQDRAALAYAEFVLGFQLIFSGAFDEACSLLERALAGAEHTGDLGLQARCLTYSTVLHRLRRDLAAASETAARSLKLGMALSMTDYVGAAHANLAWVAWREGDLERMSRETELSLAHWARLAPRYPYPFQWLARLHRVAAAIELNTARQALGDVRVILGPLQHRLPDAITRPLESALDASELGDDDLAEQHLHVGVEGARTLGLL